jgi:hypothetical protein
VGALLKKLFPKKIRNVYTSANIIVGRKLYGNIANLENNYIGIKRWENNKKINHAAEPAMQNDAKELSQNGVAIFSSGLPKQVIADIYKEYLTFIDKPEQTISLDENGKPSNNGNAKYYTSIKKPIENLPSIERLFTPELKSFLKQYYQAEFSLHSAHAWRTEHISEERLQKIYPSQPYSILWHVDGHPVDTLKMFIVLSDVADENGPLHYLTKQRTEALRKKGYFSRFKYGVTRAELEDEKYLSKLIGPSGTTAFCDTTKCLHRAGVPAEGRTRDMLQLRFESSEKPFTFPQSSDGFPEAY